MGGKEVDLAALGITASGNTYTFQSVHCVSKASPGMRIEDNRADLVLMGESSIACMKEGGKS